MLPNVISKWDRIFTGSSMLFTAFMLYQYFHYWVSPHKEDGETIYTLVIMIAFEFIMVHAGTFMTAFNNWKALLFFALLYSGFVFAFNSFVSDDVVFYSYLLMVLNRMRYAFVNVPKKTAQRIMGYSALWAICYFFSLMINAIASSKIPQFALTDSFLSQSNYRSFVKIGGLFTDEPKVAMSTGVMYFGSMLFWQILISIHSVRHPEKYQ
jgi:hypothetical protein